MPKDNNLIKVVFRAFRNGDIIALFPEIPANDDAGCCSSYIAIGQHGAATILGPGSIIRFTRPARPNEYTGLRQELAGIGYRLHVKEHITTRDHDKRQKEIQNQWKNPNEKVKL